MKEYIFETTKGNFVFHSKSGKVGKPLVDAFKHSYYEAFGSHPHKIQSITESFQEDDDFGEVDFLEDEPETVEEPYSVVTLDDIVNEIEETSGYYPEWCQEYGHGIESIEDLKQFMADAKGCPECYEDNGDGNIRFYWDRG